jgi:hypothetical protein
MEHSLEKSTEQAEIIKMIVIPILGLDVEYCKSAVERMADDASMYDSMAALNPNYNPTKGNVLKRKAEALALLIDYVEKLKEIDGLEKQAKVEDAQAEKIANMFKF